MQPQEKVKQTYNDTAENYAAERIDELYKKHFDSMLLREFASAIKDRGLCADFGCGPGQTTKFLYDQGIKDIIGIDLSPGMVSVAKRHFSHIKFETGDLLNLSYPSNHFGSTIAFYSIVHFTYDQVKIAFSEINRVLKQRGPFLFSFHVGDRTVHFDTAGGKKVDVDLFFFQTERIVELLHETGFRVIDALERQPYKDVEYESRRGYIWAEKN